MDQSLADIVYPVLSYGLAVKTKLSAGQAVELVSTQAMFMELLKVNDVSVGTHICGDTQRSVSLSLPVMRSMDASLLPEQFLGIRYALVCWLDELFTDETLWGRKWNESKLEVELYGSNDRAWKFWSQAPWLKLGRRPIAWKFSISPACWASAAICAQPEELQKWIAGTRQRLGQVSDVQWPLATEIEPETAVPPLRGRLQLRRLIAVACVVLLFAIPTLSFLAVHHLSE